MEFRFRLERYGIDVPVVKPYSRHMSQLAPRPLRADARRNRERVLTAAQVVFAEHGREAQMDDVARRAGVGVGTVYRHFPTKEALIEALAVDRFERIARGRARRRSSARIRGRRSPSALWAGARADRVRPRVHRDRGRDPGPDAAAAPSCSRSMNETFGELMRARAGLRRPARRTSCSTTSRCSCAASASAPRKTHACPDAWRRHLVDRASTACAPRAPRRRCRRLAAPSLWGMTAPDTVTDPDLQEVAWDLSHLLDGAGRRSPGRRRRAARRRADARRRVRRALRRQGRRARRRRADRGDARARRDRGDRRPRRHLRAPRVLDRHRRSRRSARCCSASRRRAPRSRPRCCSSTSSGRRSTTRAPRSCWPPTGWTSPATTSRPRAATGRTC